MRVNWSRVLKKPNNRQAGLGFTLIEIMIAVLIVSVGVIGVMTAMAKSIDITVELERRTVASWVVSNRISEVLHLSKTESVSAGNDTDTVKMGGYEWRVRTRIEETELDRVYLLTVDVRDKNQREDLPVVSMTSSLSDKL